MAYTDKQQGGEGNSTSGPRLAPDPQSTFYHEKNTFKLKEHRLTQIKWSLGLKKRSSLSGKRETDQILERANISGSFNSFHYFFATIWPISWSADAWHFPITPPYFSDMSNNPSRVYSVFTFQNI